MRRFKVFPYGLLLPVIVLIGIAACKKYIDVPANATDPRFNHAYCNDPTAVNYNWDFPGTPDNSVCYYPSDVFKGNYTFNDSLFNGALTLLGQHSYTLHLYALSHTRLAIVGFCGPTDSIYLTASRTLRADIDSVKQVDPLDSTQTIVTINGQTLCRPVDTLNGYLLRDLSDTTHLSFHLTEISDTGTIFHTALAVRQ